MEIRLLTNNDFMQLLKLYIAMHKVIDSSIDDFGSANTLMFDINTKEDFTALGLYKDKELVGFTTGYRFSKKCFHFSGIYVILKNSKWVKELIQQSIDLVASKGYSAWSADATNSNISSILEKFGSQVKYTRYETSITG